MKSNVTRKPWKKVVRIAYASLIILQSVLITPALTYASSGQQPLTATLLAQRDATVSSSEVGVNKGNSNLLYVTTSTDGGVKHFSDLLLWFDTSTLPTGATIVSAQLVLLQEDSSGDANYTVAPEALPVIGKRIALPGIASHKPQVKAMPRRVLL